MEVEHAVAWLLELKVLTIEPNDRVIYNMAHPIFFPNFQLHVPDAIVQRICQWFYKLGPLHLPSHKGSLWKALQQICSTKQNVDPDTVLKKLIELEYIAIASDGTITYFPSPVCAKPKSKRKEIETSSDTDTPTVFAKKMALESFPSMMLI
jgi:hypothetical protein